MAIFASLIARLGMDTKPWDAGAERAKAKLKDLEQSSGGALKRIKSQLGEESTLGNIGKIAAGGGAVAAVSLIGRLTRQATDHILEMNKALKSGEISAGEYWAKLGAGMPVLGEWFSVGQNIRKMLVDEESAYDGVIAAADRTIKKNQEAIANQKKWAAESARIHEAAVDQVAKANQEAAILAVPEGRDRNFARINQEEADAKAAAYKNYAALQHAAELDSLKKRLKTVGTGGNEVANALKLQIAQIQKDQAQSLKDYYAVETAIHKQAQAKITDILKKEEQARAEAEVKFYEEAEAEGKKLADDANLAAFEKQRRKLLDGLNYQGHQDSTVRGGGIVLRNPLEEQMTRLSQAQFDTLKSIDRNIEKLTGKKPDDDDLLANF